MKLTEVQDAITPAATAALNKGLDYKDACRAFSLIVVAMAVDLSGGSLTEAARRLRLTKGRVSQILQGHVKGGGGGRHEEADTWGKRNGKAAEKVANLEVGG